MRKRKFLSYTAAAAILAVAFINAVPAAAATGDGHGYTTGKITLNENDGTTPPVNPEDPGTPQTPYDPSNPPTGNKGPLSLDVAPAAFDFGEQEMYASDHTYYAEGDFNQYLQVTDNRDADISGWTVTVKQDDFLRNDTYTLTGATITVPAGVGRNSLNVPSTDVDTSLVTTQAGVNGTEQTVFAATEVGSGKAQSTDTWSANKVSLKIPAKTAKQGEYHNTLTWTLTAAAAE